MKKMPSSQAMAVVGRLLPGIMPMATTRITRSAMLSNTTTHVGAVPASEIGHSTGLPPGCAHRRTGFRRGNEHSLAAAGPTKLET